jgi:Lactoylglutathione lyase and related lyases
MKIDGKFDHFNINVTNLERSIKFYSEMLGLKESKRIEDENGAYILVYLSDGKSPFMLELTWLRDKDGAYQLGDNESHLCFRIANDYEKAREFYREKGVLVFENHDMGLYFIEDSDGYWIEILPA